MPNPRLPDQLKELQGSLNVSRVNDLAPDADLLPADTPPPPMSRQARALWEQYLPELVKLGTVARVDYVLLAEYCTIAANQLQAISRGEYVDPGPHARWVCAQLGVGAGVRGSLKIDKPKKDTKVNAFAGGRPKLVGGSDA